MNPDEQPVSVREFERSHAEIREDMNKLRQSDSDEHADVVEKFEALEEKVADGFKELSKELGKVVTWPQLATLLTVLCVVGGFVFIVVDHT